MAGCPILLENFRVNCWDASPEICPTAFLSGLRYVAKNTAITFLTGPASAFREDADTLSKKNIAVTFLTGPASAFRDAFTMSQEIQL